MDDPADRRWNRGRWGAPAAEVTPPLGQTIDADGRSKVLGCSDGWHGKPHLAAAGPAGPADRLAAVTRRSLAARFGVGRASSTLSPETRRAGWNDRPDRTC